MSERIFYNSILCYISLSTRSVKWHRTYYRLCYSSLNVLNVWMLNVKVYIKHHFNCNHVVCSRFTLYIFLYFSISLCYILFQVRLCNNIIMKCGCAIVECTLPSSVTSSGSYSYYLLLESHPGSLTLWLVSCGPNNFR